MITASTGNHGQGLALAGRLLKIPASVFTPETANPGKLAMIKALGASVVSVGHHLDDCKETAKEEAPNKKSTSSKIGNEISICAGTATISLQIIEAHSEIDTMVVPVGNGALISGIAFVAKQRNPKIGVIGVQSEGAPCMYSSWKQRQCG